MYKMPQEISSLVNEVFNRDEDSEDQWIYPSNLKGVLFEATYKHNKIPGCDACVRDMTGIITWNLCYRINPRIHYSNINSGSLVIKNTLEQDFLAKRDNILYFEMEAAGLIDDFRCVIGMRIRTRNGSHRRPLSLLCMRRNSFPLDC